MRMGRPGFLLAKLALTLIFLGSNTQHPALSARDIRGGSGDFPLRGSFFLSMNKQTYSVSEPIYVQCTVQAFGNRLDPLRIYPNPQHSLEFFVIDQKGVAVPLKKKQVKKRLDETKAANSSREVQMQMQRQRIEISAGDAYVKQVNLMKHFDFQPKQQYTVQAVFYPYGFSGEKVFSKNRVSFMLVDSSSSSSFAITKGDADLFQNSLPESDEIVEIFLLAKKRGDRRRMLKYLELPLYIKSYPQFQARYVQQTEQGKLKVLQEFADYLTTADDSILTDFSIQSHRNIPYHAEDFDSAYQSIIQKASVRVVVTILRSNQKRRFHYTYLLHRTRQYRGRQPFSQSLRQAREVEVRAQEWGALEHRDEWKIIAISATVPTGTREN